MRFAIIGYGKMGQAIERIAKSKGHEVPVIIDQDNIEDIHKLSPTVVDAAIEFTRPESAYPNIKVCLENGVPVVSGTTGWLEKKTEIEGLCDTKGGAFFYASNYSVGVNIFFHLNKILAKMMNNFPHYDAKMEETHHIHKLDEPSGTAITLAEGVMQEFKKKNKWVLDNAKAENEIEIKAFREGEVPGTHVIKYASDIDTIEIKHTAHNREGFAGGAVIAAEWIVGKKGIFSMDDMLKL